MYPLSSAGLDSGFRAWQHILCNFRSTDHAPRFCYSRLSHHIQEILRIRPNYQIMARPETDGLPDGSARCRDHFV